MNQLTPEERATGQSNYYEAVGFTRREFMHGVIAAGAVSGAGLGAMYFGYQKVGDPVRVGVIGTGDEGNVLIGGCTPEYVQVTAIADIRPYSIYRAFHGDWSSPAAAAARPGLIKQYKYASEAEARKSVKVYDGSNGGIEALLDDDSIEAVIIALPLHLHAPIAVKAMMKGKHVLTEKLMAHNIAQCKVMARVAASKSDSNGNPLHCATGHQRHYSVLYDNAVHLLRWGMIGQLHHIRAQWHRGNLPGNDSWFPPLPGDAPIKDGLNRIQTELAKFRKELDAATSPAEKDTVAKKVAQWAAWMEDKNVEPTKYGYLDKEMGGRTRSAMEELVRWRIFDRTGGGLMAELGSHQLDAATIFCSALRADGKKAHPLSVHAVGGRHIFPADRDCDDHVYCSFEFPGPEYSEKFEPGYKLPNNMKKIAGYSEDPNKKIVVTYSSINGNGYGGYGEVVLGTKGTMIIEKEQDVLLYAGSDTAASAGVKSTKGGYALDTQASGGSAAPVEKAASGGPVSKGYTEEIEHWAYCIRNPDPSNRPKCYPEVAMADAVIALTTNVAMKRGARGEAGFVKFEESWFNTKSDETPDGSSVAEETKQLESYKIQGGQSA